MFTRHSLRKVQWRPKRHCFSLLISIYFTLGKQKSIAILNNLFYMNMKFDKLLSEIDNVLQKKRELGLRMPNRIRLKEFNISNFMQRHGTM